MRSTKAQSFKYEKKKKRQTHGRASSYLDNDMVYLLLWWDSFIIFSFLKAIIELIEDITTHMHISTTNLLTPWPRKQCHFGEESLSEGKLAERWGIGSDVNRAQWASSWMICSYYPGMMYV